MADCPQLACMAWNLQPTTALPCQTVRRTNLVWRPAHPPSMLLPHVGATWFHGLGTPERPNPVFRHAVDQGLIGTSPEGETETAAHRIPLPAAFCRIQSGPAAGVAQAVGALLLRGIPAASCPAKRAGCAPVLTYAAAETWWSSQFLLSGASEPLSKEQQLAVTHALAAWTDTVEGLPPDASGTTADHLRAAWDGLLGSGKLRGGDGQVEAAARAWRWRELLQRAMDGCHSTADQRCGSRAAGPACLFPVVPRLHAQSLAAAAPYPPATLISSAAARSPVHNLSLQRPRPEPLRRNGGRRAQRAASGHAGGREDMPTCPARRAFPAVTA